MSLSWLESICDPDSPHEFCRRPYATVDLWGEAFATDGWLLVMLDAEDHRYQDATEKDERRIAAALKANHSPPVGRVRLAALREWCGPREADKQEPCDNCHGSGRCNHCACDAEHDCGDCNGEGSNSVASVRWGRVAASVIDRNRLAKAVPHLPGGDGEMVTVHATAGKAVKFVGRGWVVMLAEADENNMSEDAGPELRLETTGGNEDG